MIYPFLNPSITPYWLRPLNKGSMSIIATWYQAYNPGKLFELFTGQPPFDSIMITPPALVRQMLDTTGDELPQRWQSAWRAMEDANTVKFGQTQKLQEWLEEVYFDGDMEVSLTREDIVKVGKLVRKLLQFEPLERASARDLLQDSWFQEG
jgi:serine/threonine protein kinase